MYRNWFLSLPPLVAHEDRTVGRRDGRENLVWEISSWDSREIFRGKLRARCIIGGRETSVIYHKLL